ncbi:hypothetical protein HZH68_011381 [Vespula germanica]|uniref:Uncharacterized protein n=1 Tax=Vespula germanica TaxID=30212 RepID=A0A834JND8_VESGE|nr:hypothetical protein HZH68_011381 [Vespula germanica]
MRLHKVKTMISIKMDDLHCEGGTSLVLFLILAVSIIEIQSASFAKLYQSSYQYPQMIRPEYFQIAHQNGLAPYYIYNLFQVHTDLTPGSPTILPEKQTTTLTHLPPYGYYYYDFRFPINPVYPVLSPSHPGFIPVSGSPPISTDRPFDVDNDDDSGIEKLDTKVEPEKEMRKPDANDGNYDDDDTITIEAIK